MGLALLVLLDLFDSLTPAALAASLRSLGYHMLSRERKAFRLFSICRKGKGVWDLNETAIASGTRRVNESLLLLEHCIMVLCAHYIININERHNTHNQHTKVIHTLVFFACSTTEWDHRDSTSCSISKGKPARKEMWKAESKLKQVY